MEVINQSSIFPASETKEHAPYPVHIDEMGYSAQSCLKPYMFMCFAVEEPQDRDEGCATLPRPQKLKHWAPELS